MEKFYDYVKTNVIHYKLQSCCWLAPVRIGVLIIGYFNVFMSAIYLLATANDSFSPTLKKVQEKIVEEASISLCTIAYGTELSLNVLLVCAMHRNDVALLRIYTYYTIAATILALVVYSVVFIAIDALIKFAIIFNTVFNIYVIILVRSAIVEIKEKKQQQEFERKYNVLYKENKLVIEPTSVVENDVKRKTIDDKIDVEQTVSTHIVNNDIEESRNEKERPSATVNGSRADYKPDPGIETRLPVKTTNIGKERLRVIVERPINVSEVAENQNESVNKSESTVPDDKIETKENEVAESKNETTDEKEPAVPPREKKRRNFLFRKIK